MDGVEKNSAQYVPHDGEKNNKNVNIKCSELLNGITVD